MENNSLYLKLFDYQKEAFQKYCEAPFFALFFEPGLGKTLTLIAILKYRLLLDFCKYPLLIVPKPLIQTWINEFDKWWPDHPLIVFLNKDGIIRENEKIIYITNVDKFSFGFSPVNFFLIDFICIDEATKIKSMSSIRTKTLLKISKKIKQKAILTGTPFTSSPLSLYPLLKFLDPSLTPYPFSTFRQYFAVIVFPPPRSSPMLITEKFWNSIKKMEYQSALNIFHISLEDYMFVQSSISFTPYKHLDKLAPLCEKVGMFAKASLNTQTSVRLIDDKKYCKLTESEEFEIDSKMAYLMALRKKASISPLKLQTLFEDVEPFLESDESLIIVTYFLQSFDLINKTLEEKKIPHVSISGSTPQKLRDLSVKRFNNKEVKVFVGSLGVISYGLNLQTSHLMFFYDSLYQYEDYVQCKKRIDRVGQSQLPRYFHYLIRDSIEEKIYKLFEDHQDVNQFLESLLHIYTRKELK